MHYTLKYTYLHTYISTTSKKLKIQNSKTEEKKLTSTTRKLQYPSQMHFL